MKAIGFPAEHIVGGQPVVGHADACRLQRSRRLPASRQYGIQRERRGDCADRYPGAHHRRRGYRGGPPRTALAGPAQLGSGLPQLGTQDPAQ